MLGNHCADVSATTSLNGTPTMLRQWSNQLYDHYVTERNNLLEVCKYAVALNRARIALLDSLEPCNTDPAIVQDISTPSLVFDAEKAFWTRCL